MDQPAVDAYVAEVVAALMPKVLAAVAAMERLNLTAVPPEELAQHLADEFHHMLGQG